MRVIQIFNRYRVRVNGEETVVRSMAATLEHHGVKIARLEADSATLDRSLTARIAAGLLAAYNPVAYSRMARLIASFGPDIAHAHNLLPLLSPSVLAACRNAGVASVFTAHSYALSCPVATHLKGDEICLQCAGGRQHRCLTNNCRGALIESAAYAIRSTLIDRLALVRRNVSVLHVLSEFAKRHYVSEGFPEERVVVLPNAVEMPMSPTDPCEGQYIAFAGRLEHVKGLDLVLAASRITGLPVAIAGDTSKLHLDPEAVPASVRFVGVLDQGQMAHFYRAARFLVFPSRLLEMCPMAILEAMSHGLPIVCSAIGGLGEIVGHGQNGLLVPVNDAEALAEAMMQLWRSPSMMREMGRNSWLIAKARYDGSNYVQGLLALYARAIDLGYSS